MQFFGKQHNAKHNRYMYIPGDIKSGHIFHVDPFAACSFPVQNEDVQTLEMQPYLDICVNKYVRTCTLNKQDLPT